MKIKSVIAALIITCISFSASARQAGDTYENRIDHNLSYEVVELDGEKILTVHYAKYKMFSMNPPEKHLVKALRRVTDDIGIESFKKLGRNDYRDKSVYQNAISAYWHYDISIVLTDENLK